ncbi:MAG: hypothetical protein RIR48_1701 [Bacteroidota bacterium]
MDIKALLLKEHSKAVTSVIVNYYLKHPDKIDELMDCFFESNYRICQRAAWPVGILGEKNPEIIISYLPKLITNLTEPKHDAIIRNTVRIWQKMKIPENFQGEVFELCFNFILNPKAAIAIRAFSMTVCANIAKDIPELREELILAISDQLENSAPGIISRGNKIINNLRK